MARSRVRHGLLAGRGLASLDYPLESRLQYVPQVLHCELLLTRGRLRHAKEERAVERTPRAAHGADQRHPGLLEDRCRVGAILVERLLAHGFEATVHVAAVIRVTYRRVQSRELFRVLGEGGGQELEPGPGSPGVQDHIPHRRPGVSTGASQSRIMSSS